MTEQEIAVLATLAHNGAQTYAQALDRLEELGLVERYCDYLPGARLTVQGALHIQNLMDRLITTPNIRGQKPGPQLSEVWK